MIEGHPFLYWLYFACFLSFSVWIFWFTFKNIFEKLDEEEAKRKEQQRKLKEFKETVRKIKRGEAI